MQVAWTEVPKTLDNLFYALDPLVSGILMSNMVQWSYHKAVKNRSGTHWQIYGPVWLVFAGFVNCMALPMATLFIYVGELGYPGSKMWKGSFFPNTPHGITFYAMKFIGTGCLLAGVMQITGLHKKIRSKWQKLRNPTDQSTDVEASSDTKLDGSIVDTAPAEEKSVTGG